MSSNQNSINNDFNFNQICKDCRNGINSIIDNMPFFIKIVVFSTLIFFIINLFTPYPAFYLVDIPYFTIFHLQIWRLFTTAFITTGLISIVFSLFFWYRHAVKLERDKGTVKYMLTFFMNCFFIQLMYCLLMIIISLVIQNSMMMKMKLTMGGVRNQGLWPILMCELTLMCLSNPEANMRFFFFPCVIKAKYYPLVLFAIFTLLSNFQIDFEILCGIVFGFLNHYYLKDKIEINNVFALKVENSFLCHWMINKKGFISINNTNSPEIPVNIENVANVTPAKNFSAFKGKGVAVGSSDSNTTRDNVDYANLTARTSDDNTSSNDSKLEINLNQDNNVFNALNKQ
jgi:membrane associated rhomboid family serine protease